MVLIYSHGCVACERARPVTMQALSDINNSTTIKVNYVEYVDTSKEGLEYIDRYHLNGVPGMVINGNTVIGSDEFEGDRGVVYNLIIQKIKDANQYKVPVTIDRTIIRDPSNASMLIVSNTIRNEGNETVILSFSDGEGNGINVIAGKASWEGAIQPGNSVSLAYNATVSGDIDRTQSPEITYLDTEGSHVIVMPEDTVPPVYRFDVLTLLAAGVIAGFNPCIIAILIFISAEVASATGNKWDVMLNVLVFCLGILVVYLLIGAGLFEAVSFIPWLSDYLEYAVIIIILALAAYSFLNAYQRYSGKAPGAATRSLIASVKPLYTKYRLAGSFLLGGLFGMVKMPCAGGIYLAILSKIVLSKEVISGAFYLLVFDFGVILPVLALGLLLALGFGAERMEKIRSRHAVLLHILNGSILVLLAAGFFFNII
ncbi:MAG TPA: cytochrome c biogenesis protein CcdA [Methanocella sp.]|uniref:urease accessory protein UreH domain-containing protein n=1 Tax=Methanocella sp. TaxID=2052833 RepID=UPI002C4ADA07|nr:cytochrome c biogenesis protein CcdA [Methanocella sp.]HTY91979.1 cytochrome c biogenesis protein CcdA [Methanocella sp.]